jgi:hypothetical protein
MSEEKDLIKKIGEAENVLGLKRLESQQLPARILECEAEMKGLSEPEVIRQCMARKRELERESEVFALVLRSHAVAVEEAYAKLYKERLAASRTEAEAAHVAHDSAVAAFKEAEQALEAAQARQAKAVHDVAYAERELQTRQNNASNLRSGNVAAAAI